MPYARRRSDAPPEPDLAALAAETAANSRLAAEQLARARGLLDAAEAGEPLPGWLDDGKLSLLIAGLRQTSCAQAMTGEQLSRLSLEQAFSDMFIATAEGSGFRQGVSAAAGGRHRAPRASRSRKPGKDQPPLFGIPGGKTTAAAVGLAASIVAGTVGTGAYSDLAHLSPVPVAHHGPAALPVLSPADAIPVALPSVQPSYEGRHRKPSPTAVNATLAPPPPVYTPAPPQDPSAQPSAAPGGTLDGQTVTVAIGPGGRGSVTFMAVGGPLEWQASASGPALDLSDYRGTLADGESFTITVTVRPGSLAGSGTVTVSAGGQQVTVPVTWVALPGLGL